MNYLSNYWPTNYYNEDYWPEVADGIPAVARPLTVRTRTNTLTVRTRTNTLTVRSDRT